MVFSFIVPSAALEAGDVAFHRADAGKRGAAFAAGVEVSAFKTDALQRKIMAPGFVRDAEILASFTPLGAVWRDLTASGTMLS